MGRANVYIRNVSNQIKSSHSNTICFIAIWKVFKLITRRNIQEVQVVDHHVIHEQIQHSIAHRIYNVTLGRRKIKEKESKNLCFNFNGTLECYLLCYSFCFFLRHQMSFSFSRSDFNSRSIPCLLQ